MLSIISSFLHFKVLRNSRGVFETCEDLDAMPKSLKHLEISIIRTIKSFQKVWEYISEGPL